MHTFEHAEIWKEATTSRTVDWYRIPVYLILYYALSKDDERYFISVISARARRQQPYLTSNPC